LSRLFDYEQAAQYLNTTPRCVRYWVSTGRIPYSKLGKLVRFDPVRLAEWVRSQERGPKVQVP
jgi:excisionase family DNA binding protein